MMYKKVDEILAENSSDNYFYDDEFLYVYKLLDNFTSEDWEWLFQNIKNKDDKYKTRLAYCIDEGTGINGFNMLLKLMNEGDEVVESVIDSLRSFDGDEYKAVVKSNKQIFDRVENLLQKASFPVKQILESFLEGYR